jgi:transcriptional regulator with XRE-family HTH domain
MSISKISIRQIKAARSLLGWSQDDLAEKSGISKPTIGRLESQDGGALGGRAETGDALVVALERGGIEFIAENGGGAGVRLKKRPGKR